jgi:hypothetical protein
MKGIKKQFIIIIIILSVVSCNNHFDQVATEIDPNAIKVHIPDKSSIAYSDLFDSIRVIPLETNRESFVRRVDKIYVTKDKIYIFDIQGKQILMYKLDGGFIRKFSNIGEGTGKFLSPYDVAFDRENHGISVYDRNVKYNKIIFLDSSLNFQYEKKIPFLFSEYSILNKGKEKFLFDIQYGPVNSISNQLLITDSSFKVLKKAIPFNTGLSFFLSGIDGNGRLGEDLYLPHFSPIFYSIQDTNFSKQKYYIDFESGSIMPPSIAERLDGSNYNKIVDEGNYVTNVNFTNNKRNILISFSKKDDLYTAIYSIKSGKVRLLQIKRNPSCGCGSIYYYKTFVGDDLIGVVEPANFQSLINMLDPEKKTRIIDSSKTLNSSGNLILLLGKLKQF